MYGVSRHFAAAAVIGLCIIRATAARAEDQDRNDKPNRYVITNLDSDLKGAAAVQGHAPPEFLGRRVFFRRQSFLDRRQCLGVRDALQRRRHNRASTSQYSIAGQRGAHDRL